MNALNSISGVSAESAKKKQRRKGTAKMMYTKQIIQNAIIETRPLTDVVVEGIKPSALLSRPRR